MTRAIMAFGIAVAGTSLLCYALLTRAERITRNRRSAGDASSASGGTSGSEGWAVAGWFGGDHTLTDSSGDPTDVGGSDGGGGDGGGGGD